MRLTHEVHLNAGPAQVFDALRDPGKLSAFLPGDGLRVGPLTVSYTGTVRVLAADPPTVRLRAIGHERRGQGDADAHVTAHVVPDGEGTRIALEIDLTVRGNVARFGGGSLGEVSRDLLDEFAAAVDRSLAAEPPPPERRIPLAVAVFAGLSVLLWWVARARRGTRRSR